MRDFIARKRIHISLGVTIALVAVLFMSKPTILGGSVLSFAMEHVGFLLVVVGAMGRVWCSMHISGRKGSTLVTTGPYAMHRNPLYFYSFVGVVGFGIASRNLPFMGLVAAVFILMYPIIVRSEEEALLETHGEDFRAYCETTPRWIPRFRKVEQVNEQTLHVRKMERSMLDAAVFFLAYLLADLVFELHQLHLLPELW